MEKRTEQIVFRTTAAHRAWADQSADQQGVSVSDVMNRLITEARGGMGNGKKTKPGANGQGRSGIGSGGNGARHGIRAPRPSPAEG